jgi:germination protein M
LRRAGIVLLGSILLLAVGCGGEEAAPETTATTTTVPGPTADVRVYWLREGKVWPAHRAVKTTDLVATSAVAELLVGPSKQEKSDLKARTAIPGTVDEAKLDIAGGVAKVKLSGRLPKAGVCQLVYTLTQFPDVQSVEIEGGRHTRRTCEDVTPAILVESPLPFERVTSPVHATGTANTFEANFHYELTDTDGRIVSQNFVTATSGTGTRGMFELTAPFTAPFDGIGELIVFERSAENGERIHLVEVPLRMKKTPP